MIRRLVNAAKRRLPRRPAAPGRAITKPSAPVVTDGLIVDVDWAAMSPAEQGAFYDENGFLVVSQAISRQDLETIHREIKAYGLTGLTADIWQVPSFLPLIENEKILSPLHTIFGEDLRFFKGAYVETPPVDVAGEKARPKVFHVDYGVGESGGDFYNSCASWVNIGLYLTDMTPELAPFWVVPGSNRHYDVVPSSDMESMEDKAKIVLPKAGDAVFIHCMTVHAGGHNVSNTTRHAIFLSYRPAWARPAGPVPEWPQEFIDKAPPKRKRLLVGLNQGL